MINKPYILYIVAILFALTIFILIPALSELFKLFKTSLEIFSTI